MSYMVCPCCDYKLSLEEWSYIPNLDFMYCPKCKTTPYYYFKQTFDNYPTTDDMWFGAKLLSQIAEATSHIIKRCTQ